MRLLRGGVRKPSAQSRPGRRRYDDRVGAALIVLWEAGDRICGKRLKALMPILVAAMERHGHLQLEAEVRTALLGMSAATIDRVLQGVRRETKGRSRRRSSVPTGVRRSVPIRTFSDWDDPAPGFCEADLVLHCGPVASGSFIQTLVLTDVATGWTECAPLLVREQTVLSEVLTALRQVMPFALLGFDTDNDTVFMNETVRDYCAAHGIALTRCRPYRKNDQAFVEQKNGAVVRHIVGYLRYEGLEAAAALAELYASVRLFVNVFQPSFKLAEKERDGAFVRKRYHAPATPYQRLIADPRTTDATRGALEALCIDLDPVRLLRDIRAAQQRLVAISDLGASEPLPRDGGKLDGPTLDQFLRGLRVAWKGGEVRPTAKPKPVVKRGRRRPDPLVKVTGDLHAWFDAEPWRTGRDLLDRLQAEHPGAYPDALLRTLQRRLKIWRQEAAHALVLGPLVIPPLNETAGSTRMLPSCSSGASS